MPLLSVLRVFENPNLELSALDVREQVGDRKRGDEIGEASAEPAPTKHSQTSRDFFSFFLLPQISI